MFELLLLILAAFIIIFDVRGEIVGSGKDSVEAVQNLTIDKVLYRISSEFSSDGSLKGKLMKWAADKTISEAKKAADNSKNSLDI